MDQAVIQSKLDMYQRLIGAATFPRIFKGAVGQVIALSQNPRASAKDLATIVASDPVISSKVMTVVHSRHYSLNSEISSLAQAVALLGFEEIRKIAVLVSVSGAMKCSEASEVMKIWKHSICVGIFSRIIAEHIRRFEIEAYTAGLLHDVGKILLYLVNPQAAKTVQNNYLFERGNVSYQAVENRLLGIDHAWIGYFAAGQGNLTDSIREAILTHHHPTASLSYASGIVARIVYIADLIAVAIGYPSVFTPPSLSPPDLFLEMTDQLLGTLQIDEGGFRQIMDRINTSGLTEARNFMSALAAPPVLIGSASAR
ncbi:MAG: HDOD domain-containing protein [Armatimonadetes bacterium]|nr:HDOD domain-containing protein [Armatimonadota bacterium]